MPNPWDSDPIDDAPAARAQQPQQPQAPRLPQPGQQVIAPLRNPRQDAQDAEARRQAAVREANEAERIRIANEQLELARQKATQEAASTGGVHPTLNRPLTKAEQATDTIFAKRYADWRTNGQQAVANSLDDLRGVIQQLDESNNISGPFIGAMPDTIQAFLTPEALDVKQTVQEQIARTLREVLGGQFARLEGEQLLQRGFDPRLDEAVNKRRTERLLRVAEAAAAAEESRAQHFEQYGTFAGWNGLSGEDIVKRANAAGEDLFNDEAVLAGAVGAPPSPPPPPSGGNPQPTPAFNLQGAAETPSPQMQIVSGGDPGQFRTERDPERAGQETRFRAMLFGGASGDQLEAYLREIGVSEPAQIEAARGMAEIVRNNPGISRDAFDTSGIEMRVVPITDTQRALGSALEATGRVGAGAVAAVDSALGQNTARFAENPEGMREALGMLREEYPGSTLIGDMAGATAATLGAGKFLGALGMGGRAAPLAAEALVGGATGYGVGGEDAGVSDVALGTVTGLGAAQAGRVLARGGLEAAVPSGGSANARALEARGVTGMTPGQRFGQGGPLGRIVSTAEEALETIPITGGRITASRARPLQDFQRVTMNEVLGPIGVKVPPSAKIGQPMFRYAYGKIDDAFRRAEKGMTFEADPVFLQDRAQFELDLGANQLLTGKERSTIMGLIDNNFGTRLDPSGNQNITTLQGDALSRVISSLEKEAGTKSRAVRQQVQEFVSLVRDAASRNPNTQPDALDLYAKARESYSLLSVVSTAAAKDAKGGSTFTPSDLLQASKETDTSAFNTRFLQGDARLQDIATEGQTLENRVFQGSPIGRAQSGVGATARDSAPSLGLLGLGVGGFASPGVALAAMSPTIAYAPGARNALAAVTRPRGSAKTRARARKIRRGLGNTSAAVAEAAALSQLED